MAQYAAIAGWGMDLPQRVLTNQDLERMVDTSDEWIRTRTGISERRLVAEGEATSSMAIRAARQALERANLPPFSVDLIIVATSTPDYAFPATACLVQDAIGAIHAAAFDMEAACSGFIYALSVGTNLVRSGEYQNVLVIAADTLSRITNWQDRNTCILFGDGAGAVVLRATTRRRGLLACTLGAYGAGYELIIQPAGGSARPATAETVATGQHFVHMRGNEVFRFAVRTMGQAVQEVLEKAALRAADVALFVPHQANLRIIEALMERLGLPRERVWINIERYGNMSAATVPVSICEAAEAGRLHDGDRVVAVAFGSGLTWGAAVIEWGR